MLQSDNGRTKPIPKLKKKKAGSSPKKAAGGTTSPEPEDNLCLLRAMDGKKKKISTVVHAKDVTRFQLVSFIRHTVESLCSGHSPGQDQISGMSSF